MKINQIQVVTSFKSNEGVVLSTGSRLQDLHKRLGGRLMMLNVPEGASPETPRAILKTSDSIVNVCFNRFDITTKPPAHVAVDATSAFNFAKLRVEPILSTLFSDSLDYAWSGIVVEYLFPKPGARDSAIKSMGPIFDRLIKQPRNNRQLASFQLQFGFEENDYFKNFIVDGFETRSIKLPPKMSFAVGQTIELDVTQFPLSEAGLQIKADVNNKPSAAKTSALGDFKAILREHESTSSKVLSHVGLPEDLWG